jgi:protein-disulfide isomerase
VNARSPGEYGPVRSADELIWAIHVWRRHIPSAGSLWIDVEDGRDHLRGDPAAPLVVVEYGDYQCEECAEAHALQPLVRPWLQDGRLCVVFRHFPLLDAHPLSLRAAQAAEAAAVQGRFWAMHDLLMENEVVGHESRHRHMRKKAPLDTIELDHAARRAGLDIDRFRADIDDPAVLQRVLEDFRGGLAGGVNGTPTFFVNGRRADSVAVEEIFAQIIAPPASAAVPTTVSGRSR